MAAGTNIRPVDRPVGNFQNVLFDITPTLVAAQGTVVHTVAVPLVQVNDEVDVTPPAGGAGAGIIVCNARVSAPGVVSFETVNVTGAGITPTAGTYSIFIARGSTRRGS